MKLLLCAEPGQRRTMIAKGRWHGSWLQKGRWTFAMSSMSSKRRWTFTKKVAATRTFIEPQVGWEVVENRLRWLVLFFCYLFFLFLLFWKKFKKKSLFLSLKTKRKEQKRLKQSKRVFPLSPSFYFLFQFFFFFSFFFFFFFHHERNPAWWHCEGSLSLQSRRSQGAFSSWKRQADGAGDHWPVGVCDLPGQTRQRLRAQRIPGSLPPRKWSVIELNLKPFFKEKRRGKKKKNKERNSNSLGSKDREVDFFLLLGNWMRGKKED